MLQQFALGRCASAVIVIALIGAWLVPVSAPARGGSKSTLTITVQGGAFAGKLKASKASCVKGRAMKVFEAGSNRAVGEDVTSKKGRYLVQGDGTAGDFFAKAGKSGKCKRVRSETITLPAPGQSGYDLRTTVGEPADPVPSGEIKWTFRVENAGPDVARGVTVEIGGTMPSPGAVCSSLPLEVRSLGDIPAGGATQSTYTGTCNGPGEIRVVATAKGVPINDELHPGDNVDAETTTIQPIGGDPIRASNVTFFLTADAHVGSDDMINGNLIRDHDTPPGEDLADERRIPFNHTGSVATRPLFVTSHQGPASASSASSGSISVTSTSVTMRSHTDAQATCDPEPGFICNPGDQGSYGLFSNGFSRSDVQTSIINTVDLTCSASASPGPPSLGGSAAAGNGFGAQLITNGSLSFTLPPGAHTLSASTTADSDFGQSDFSAPIPSGDASASLDCHT